MEAYSFSLIFALLCQLVLAEHNSSSPFSTSVKFGVPSGYSTKVYNISAATTTLTYSYSDEELALLWDQIGPISVGPITTTVSPTSEPTAYPRPDRFHPQVLIINLKCRI
jgi:hypothetical protein